MTNALNYSVVNAINDYEFGVDSSLASRPNNEPRLT